MSSDMSKLMHDSMGGPICKWAVLQLIGVQNDLHHNRHVAKVIAGSSGVIGLGDKLAPGSGREVKLFLGHRDQKQAASSEAGRQHMCQTRTF